MKKAIKVLAVAALAALVFAGCKTGTQDVNLSTGTANYDLSGKTLVSTDNSYYTKQVTTSVTTTVAGKTTTATTNVQSNILAKVTTTTLKFVADQNVFTASTTKVWQSGADGDYRNSTTTTTSGTTITTVTTAYYDINNNNIDAVYTGLSGVKTNEDTATGTWKKYDQQDSATDGQTVLYKVLVASSTTATTGVTSATTHDQTTSSTVASDKKVTYSTTNTTTNSGDWDTTNYDSLDYWQNSTKKDSAGVECDYLWIKLNSINITGNMFYVYTK